MTERPSGKPRHYSPELAAQALRRAARLQVEAAERAERHSGPSIGSDPEPEGFARDELVVAAKEAGIDEEFISVALAEVDDGAGTSALALRDQSQERAATRWLGTTQRNVLVSRLIDAPPDEVWPALGEVFESERVGLDLQRLADGHPTAGGVAHFTMRPLMSMMSERKGYPMLCYRMEQLQARHLRVKLREVGGQTRVTVYLDLRDGVRVNLKWVRLTSAIVGVSIGSFGVLAAAASVALGGLLGGIAITAGAWRLSYGHALRKIEQELEDLLQMVESQLLRREAYRLPAAAEAG